MSVNKLIKDNAVQVLKKYIIENEEQSLEMDYELYFVNDKILSICYSRIAYGKDNLYPRNVFSTLNIDVKKTEEISIREVLEVDSNLVDIIKKKAVVSTSNKEIISEAGKAIQDYSNDEFIKKLDNEENYEKISVYFTNDSIGFSVPVLHALGDYINYEVAYEDLAMLYLD